MPNAKQDLDILISGTGFTGLTLAVALARTFEGALKIGLIGPPLPPQLDHHNSRAFAISAMSAQMLKVLGIWHNLEAYAQPVYKIEITDTPLEAGVRPALLTYDNRLRDGMPASFIVPARSLGVALQESANSLTAIEFLPYDACCDFFPSPGGVCVKFGDGVSMQAALLLCAEGRRSTLRQKAGIDTVAWSHGQTGIVTNITHEKAHEGTAIQHFLPAGPFAVLPLPGGHRSSITWSENKEYASHIHEMQDADFIEEIDMRLGGRWGAINLDGPRNTFPLETQIARRFIGPHFALVGDAAHAVHPIAGQGLNLGFRDIAALCECLIDSQRVGLDIADPIALERYERWRRFDVTIYANGFSSLNTFFSEDFPLLRSIREFGLGLIDKMPDIKSYLVREAAGANGALPKLMTGVCL